jgi:ABC-type polysaccharide transport system permease subunit
VKVHGNIHGQSAKEGWCSSRPGSAAIRRTKDYNVVDGIWGSPWAGLDHFERFFANPVAWDLVRNTLMLSLYGFLAGFPIPIILASALNEVRARFTDLGAERYVEIYQQAWDESK